MNNDILFVGMKLFDQHEKHVGNGSSSCNTVRVPCLQFVPKVNLRTNESSESR